MNCCQQYWTPFNWTHSDLNLVSLTHPLRFEPSFTHSLTHSDLDLVFFAHSPTQIWTLFFSLTQIWTLFFSLTLRFEPCPSHSLQFEQCFIHSLTHFDLNFVSVTTQEGHNIHQWSRTRQFPLCPPPSTVVERTVFVLTQCETHTGIFYSAVTIYISEWKYMLNTYRILNELPCRTKFMKWVNSSVSNKRKGLHGSEFSIIFITCS